MGERRQWQSHEIISRYFLKLQDRFEISRFIREMVIFARQDLVQDPPFLRLDLISCRNVLIYLQPELQAKVLATFHYGLIEGGYLFLGKSESVYQQENLFESIDKVHRIYCRSSGESKIPVASFHIPPVNADLDLSHGKKTNAEHLLLEAALKTYIPTTILINKNFDIQHIYGNVSDFLTISPGKPSINLMHLMRKELRSDLQLLLHKVEKPTIPTLMNAFFLITICKQMIRLILRLFGLFTIRHLLLTVLYTTVIS